MIASAIHVAGVQVVALAIHADLIVGQIVDQAVGQAVGQATDQVVDNAVHQAVDHVMDKTTDQTMVLVVDQTADLAVDHTTNVLQNVILAAQFHAVRLVVQLIHLTAHQLSANLAHPQAKDKDAHLNGADLDVANRCTWPAGRNEFRR